MEEMVKEELNVKEVVFRENEEELVEYSAKADFKVLGKKLGKKMKTAANKIQALSTEEIISLMDGATLALDLDDSIIELTRNHIIVQRNEKANLKVLNEGSLTVALDPEITPELEQEGLVRDIVRTIQNTRKEKDLEVTDRIRLVLQGSETIRSAVTQFEEYLKNETLAEEVEWSSAPQDETIECGDETCTLYLGRIDGRKN